MEYIKHYEKIFSDLYKDSYVDHIKQESFNFFSKSGFPIKKKGDERWKYLDLRSLEKTNYFTDYDNHNFAHNFDSVDLDKSNIIWNSQRQFGGKESCQRTHHITWY